MQTGSILLGVLCFVESVYHGMHGSELCACNVMSNQR